MRTLFVTAVFPKDFSRSVYGIFQRMRMWLDAIKSLDCELDILFLPPHGTDIGTEATSNLSKELLNHWDIRAHVTLCERNPRLQNSSPSPLRTFIKTFTASSHHPFFSAYSGDRQKTAFERCMRRSPDMVFFQKIYSMGPASPSLLQGTRVFVDLDDVEHLRFVREIRQPPYWRGKKLLYLEVPALWKDERAAILRSECAFVCSDADRHYLQRVMRIDNLETIPNAARWVADAPLADEQNVLFVGNGQYGPNQVAAACLIEKVWPQVKRICPQARLLMAGTGWDAFPAFRNPPEGVEFLGFVSDLDAIYRQTRVMCCPIQSGSGTRVKILEAAAYGVPVVTTAIGAEGLKLESDTEIVLRDDVQRLAETCGELLLDHTQASRIGAAGRERVRTLYGRDAVIEKIRNVFLA